MAIPYADAVEILSQDGHLLFCPTCVKELEEGKRESIDSLEIDDDGKRMYCPEHGDWVTEHGDTPNVEVTGAARLHRAASRERSERGRPPGWAYSASYSP